MWKVHCENQTNKVDGDISFLPVIDPTMLVDHDNFANVVIAQVYTQVEKKLSTELYCNSDLAHTDRLKNSFYNHLKKLADSLGKKEEFEGCRGIDKIMQYKSGISVENHFHNFIESAIDILGCSALALPIDDVDMALERAYEVVDDVRRLLGCPYIIPIVSGDYYLYEQMVNIHFDEKSYRDKTSDRAQRNKGKKIAHDLTEAYLTKVFPSNMRIPLLPIEFITPTLSIKIAKESSTIEYFDYKDLLLKEFYPLAINEEITNGWPEPKSAREFTQLVRSISPLDLAKLDAKALTERSKLWKSFLNWSNQKQNGLAFTNCESYLTLINLAETANFNIAELMSFSPKLQIANKYNAPWGAKNFYKAQLDALESSVKDGNWITDCKRLLSFAFESNATTLSSLPPLEFFHPTNTRVSNNAVRFAYENIDEIEALNLSTILRAFSSRDFYSKLDSSHRFVVISRAFEIIAYSFLLNDSFEKSKQALSQILKRKPFYSVFTMAPTKAIQGEEPRNSEKGDNENMPAVHSIAEVTTFLHAKIADWKANNKHLFERENTSRLLPLFTYLFNKVFTSFHAFRFENKESFDDEYVTDNIKRFEYMVVNAAYTAMIDGPAITASVAITPKQKTIRSQAAFARTDRVLSANKKRYEEQVASLENDSGVLFIKALETHPLFTIISDTNGYVEPKFKLGVVNLKGSKESPTAGVHHDYFSERAKEYIPQQILDDLVKHVAKRSDIYLHARNQRDVRKAVRQELNEGAESLIALYENIVKENIRVINELPSINNAPVNLLKVLEKELGS